MSKPSLRPVTCAKTFTFLLLALSTIGVSAAASKPSAPTSNWSGPTVISPALQPDPTRGSQLNDVAVNASGLTLAAWDQFTYNAGGTYTIGAAVQSGGRWSAPFTVSGTTGFSFSPRVAVGADGTMAVSWVYEDTSLTQKQIQVAVKPATASTWTTTTLAQSTLGGASTTEFVPIAIDSTGNLTAVWNLFNGTHLLVQSAMLPKGGTWSAPVTLSDPNVDARYPGLAVNARGDAAVVYSAWTASLATYAQVTSRTGANGAWSAPVTISETLSASVGYISAPRVALDGNGLATIVYQGSGIEGVRQLAPATWTSPASVLQVSNMYSYFLTLDLALDSSGNAVVATSIFDATINVDRASVWVSAGKPDGTWSPQQRLTDPAVPIDAYATQIAMSSDGSLALVGWIDHYHGTVQVAQLTSGKWGAAKTIGKGTAWSSFQEVLSLDVGSGSVARAIWKSAKSGTQIQATTYGR